MLSLYSKLKGKRREPGTTLKFNFLRNKINNMDKELAYLLGAFRDATIDERKGKNYEIKIAQKNKKWLQLIQKLLKNEFKKEGSITRHMKGYWILRINGKEIVNKIKEISEMKIPQENWNTPSRIFKSGSEIKVSYIKGFFDAEGGLPKKITKKSQKYIIFSQKNKESLEFIRKTLNELDIKPTNLTICGGVWEFRITKRKSIVKFIETIGSLHPDKKEKLRILKRVSFSPIWRGSTQGVGVAVQLD